MGLAGKGPVVVVHGGAWAVPDSLEVFFTTTVANATTSCGTKQHLEVQQMLIFVVGGGLFPPTITSNGIIPIFHNNTRQQAGLG